MVQFYGSFQQWLLKLCKPFNVSPLSLPDTKEISYENLKALLEKSQDLLLVDVRTKEEVEKGRIPGSVHVPRELLLNSLTWREKKEYQFKLIQYVPLSHPES